MAGVTDRDKALFPLKNISSVVQVFKNQLESKHEPNLALLSIIAGAVENSLTCRSNVTIQVAEPKALPILELHTIEDLYNKFYAIMRGAIDVSKQENKVCTRETIKKVSDVVWNSLTRSYYKDRAHLQSLYSYLTGRKLDCFGVAFAVVAGCQALGFSDVHLALSEDHAWVVFGENGTETAEVTWHGKGNEDKRGQEIGKGVSARSWLYVNNKPVICTRAMEVAALVSAINPSLNATLDACEVACLQQELLWLLYDLGHLTKYPMAIGNLGDLEEIAPTSGRVPCSALFQEAILSARTYYNNQHVYPYTYQGGYFYRNKMYKEAFESWANASDVIRLYNYSRDDEEIYKEFLEIANELIPHIMKVISSGFSANSILKKPECFANLLRFYDGICQWEQGSATPVLHIGWAKPLVNTISKFDAEVRAQVNIVCESECNSTLDEKKMPRSNGSSSCFNNNNNNYCMSEEHSKSNSLINEIESRVTKDDEVTNLHPSIEALTAGCSEKILNPEYLLQGGGSPFMEKESDIEMQQEQATKEQQRIPPSTSTHYSLILDTQYCESTKKILQALVKEVADNRNAILKLQKSIDRLLCVATGEPEPEIDLSQPAENIEEFLAIEEYIKIKQNYNELMCNLSKIGGKTVESTTRKIWSRLSTTRLASTICWTGANGKYCLKPLALNSLVRDAVLITHPHGKESEVQRATMLWFSHAQDRLRARKSQITTN